MLLLLLACAEPPLADAPGLLDASARAAVGQPAPLFTLPAVDGSTASLESLRGQIVVLEWFSTECPFVQHAHGQGPLDGAPERWESQGVAWLGINSNAAGKPGSDQGQTRRKARSFGMSRSPLMDVDGAVGQAYGATVTPELFVLDRDGVLVYRGAPDNAPLGAVSGGGERTPYLEEVLSAVVARSESPHGQTKAWGCTIKY